MENKEIVVVSGRRDSDLVHGLRAEEVGDRLRRAADELGRSRRVLAFYLTDMEERSLYQRTGHGSTIHFGSAQLDMSARRVRECLQAGRSLRDLQVVDAAIGSGQLSWSRVTTLLAIVQRDTQVEWVEFATKHSFRELRKEVGACQPGDRPGEGDNYSLIHKRTKIELELTDVGVAMLEEARMRFSPQGKTLNDEEVILEALRCALYGKDPVPRHAVEERQHDSQQDPVPDDRYEYVLRRDRHCCTNCEKPFDLAVHHIEARAFGGDNAPRNLLTLCVTCHSSVHRGFLRIQGDPEAETLAFTSVDGTTINRGERSPSPRPIPRGSGRPRVTITQPALASSSAG